MKPVNQLSDEELEDELIADDCPTKHELEFCDFPQPTRARCNFPVAPEDAAHPIQPLTEFDPGSEWEGSSSMVACGRPALTWLRSQCPRSRKRNYVPRLCCCADHKIVAFRGPHYCSKCGEKFPEPMPWDAESSFRHLDRRYEILNETTRRFGNEWYIEISEDGTRRFYPS